MTDAPFRGAFPHQHHDPRGLLERIEAQLLERLEEALDMAGLKLMVDLRQRHGRPAPETSSEADRIELQQLVAELLAYLRSAFHAQLTAVDRTLLEQAEAAAAHRERERLLAGQAFLARRLPDYWQRFEVLEAAHARARLEAPAHKSGWLGRVFRGGSLKPS